MDKIEAHYDNLAKTDSGLAKIDKMKFRNYYALRAGVSFSRGSHDEWNIIRSINAKRREADQSAGVVKQLAVLFDGQTVAPALYETPVAAGYVAACPTK